MCGRFNVISAPLTQFVSDLLKLDFYSKNNINVSPGNQIATIAKVNGQLTQVDAVWGIKPSWSKKLIINAQSESASNKKTFRSAFRLNRCIIPFNGWYEWQNIAPGIKKKYYFSGKDKTFAMAGILFEPNTIEPLGDELSQNTQRQLSFDGFTTTAPLKEISAQQATMSLVTLTAPASEQCLPIHQRMPLLIAKENIREWLTTDPSVAMSLIQKISQRKPELFEISTVS